MQRLPCVLALALAACSSPKATPAMPSPAASEADDGASCAAAADHTMDVSTKAAPHASPALVKKIRDALVAHCEDDRWSTATRACFAQVTSKEDERRCEDTLSEAQRQALGKEDARESESAAMPSLAQPAPPPPPPAETRGPIKKGGPKKGGDPEDGGE
jgi:hypothetical protein